MATKETGETTEVKIEGCESAEPVKEHKWLQQLIGNWTYEGEAVMGPGQPPVKSTGTETVRTLGDLWILAEGRVEMPGGGQGTTLATYGYDPQKQRFVGTFVGSMMTNLWIYEGTLDSSEKVLTLDTEGPDMIEQGKMAKYQDVIEIKSPDHRTLTSRFLAPDGTWKTFMTANYRRTT
ncbi:MAG TPA: DUF1579 domain-containing protein [Acidobacteriota bacterium]|nr:DUF1579 domain-containing protein [Acidobacteriota bacterium]